MVGEAGWSTASRARVASQYPRRRLSKPVANARGAVGTQLRAGCAGSLLRMFSEVVQSYLNYGYSKTGGGQALDFRRSARGQPLGPTQCGALFRAVVWPRIVLRCSSKAVGWAPFTSQQRSVQGLVGAAMRQISYVAPARRHPSRREQTQTKDMGDCCCVRSARRVLISLAIWAGLTQRENFEAKFPCLVRFAGG